MSAFYEYKVTAPNGDEVSMKDFEEEDREEAREELSHYDGGGELTTSFGDLLKGLKI